MIHPEFNISEDGAHHDIALARVTEPFEFSDSIQPIKLAKNEPKAGDQVLLSGFGYWRVRTNNHSQSSSIF